MLAWRNTIIIKLTFFMPFDPAPCDQKKHQPDPRFSGRQHGLGTRLKEGVDVGSKYDHSLLSGVCCEVIMSGVGTAFRPLRRPSLIQRLGLRPRQHESDAKSYCARLYYSKSGTNSWEVHFAIMCNLELHISVSI